MTSVPPPNTRLTSLDRLSTRIRYATEPDNFTLLQQYLNTNEGHAAASVEQQRQRNKLQFFLLLDTITDEVLPAHWRQGCLDCIHRPLSGLRSLADTPEHQRQIDLLLYELNASCRYVMASLDSCYAGEPFHHD